MYKADLDDDAVDRLKPLADDAAYVERRPSVLYYLARAEYGNGLFEAAVRNMERYLDATTASKSASPARRRRLRPLASGTLTTFSNSRSTNGLSAAGTLASSVSAAAVVHRRASSHVAARRQQQRRLVEPLAEALRYSGVSALVGHARDRVEELLPAAASDRRPAWR